MGLYLVVTLTRYICIYLSESIICKKTQVDSQGATLRSHPSLRSPTVLTCAFCLHLTWRSCYIQSHSSMSRTLPILHLSPPGLTNIRSKCYINVSFRTKFRFMRLYQMFVFATWNGYLQTQLTFFYYELRYHNFWCYVTGHFYRRFSTHFSSTCGRWDTSIYPSSAPHSPASESRYLRSTISESNVPGDLQLKLGRGCTDWYRIHLGVRRDHSSYPPTYKWCQFLHKLLRLCMGWHRRWYLQYSHFTNRNRFLYPRRFHVIWRVVWMVSRLRPWL